MASRLAPYSSAEVGTRHEDGRVTLWHGDSPGSKLRVKPSLLRRLGFMRSDFATMGESLERRPLRLLLPLPF